jgi:hypothetical protein
MSASWRTWSFHLATEKQNNKQTKKFEILQIADISNFFHFEGNHLPAFGINGKASVKLHTFPCEH